MLNVALPKGRLGEKVYAMFEAAGFECPSIKENNRKLIFENEEKQVRYFGSSPPMFRFMLRGERRISALPVRIFCLNMSRMFMSCSILI